MDIYRKQILISFFSDVSNGANYSSTTLPKIKNITFEFKKQSKLFENSENLITESKILDTVNTATEDNTNTNGGGMYEGSG
jgi:hypothetical protein